MIGNRLMGVQIRKLYRFIAVVPYKLFAVIINCVFEDSIVQHFYSSVALLPRSARIGYFASGPEIPRYATGYNCFCLEEKKSGI